MQLLLRDMPEVLDDSPHQEAAREEAIMLLRNVIALRWGYIIGLKDKVPGSHFKSLVGGMVSTLNTLLEVHGPHIPFCPNPPDKQLELENENASPEKPLPPSDEGSSTTASSKSAPPSVLPHDFKFLTVHVEGKSEVWTCLQAGAITVPHKVR